MPSAGKGYWDSSTVSSFLLTVFHLVIINSNHNIVIITLPLQEKDLEVANAQYAVAAAAAELAEPCDSLNSSLNRDQLEDMLGMRKNISGLEYQVSTLKEQNNILQQELNRSVSNL